MNYFSVARRGTRFTAAVILFRLSVGGLAPFARVYVDYLHIYQQKIVMRILRTYSIVETMGEHIYMLQGSPRLLTEKAFRKHLFISKGPKPHHGARE